MIRFFSILLLTLSCLVSSAQAGTLTFDTYFHNDHLGSPVAATDERSDLLWRAHFRPYGERQENPADVAFGNMGYTGHMQDADSGLVYMQARYYDPLIGRFLAVDPVEFQQDNSQSFNRYAYANNNPMRFFDPDGRMSDDAILHGGWVPGFEGNLYNGPAGWGPISGIKRGLTPQGELVNGGIVRGTSNTKGTAHKNSLDYVGDTHVYRIKGPDGTTHKIGESAQGTRARDGASKRAEQQARRLTRETGDTYTTEIRKTFPDKASARDYETRLIERSRRMYGDDVLPGNKTNR